MDDEDVNAARRIVEELAAPSMVVPDHLDETAMAELFARQHHDDAYFVDGEWLVYDKSEGRYKRDKDSALVLRLVQQTTKTARNSADVSDSAVTRFLHACSSHRGMNAIAAIASTLVEMRAERSEFDADRDLLNCKNRVLRLNSTGDDDPIGLFLPHHRRYKMTMMADVFYDAEAKCPQWEEHMRYILLDNQDEYDFLQRWFGRSLSAMSPSDNDRILMEIGQGANGKTKTNEAIARLLGDYAAPTDFGTWCANNNGGSPPRADLVKLAGKRLVITSEPSGDHVLDESVLKQYTGGEMVTPRAMYARTETVYRPEFALVIGTNHEPVMKDTSSGFWRRFKKMVFARNIPEEEWDTDFEAKVEKELSGILNWLIGGNRSWREKGLLPPESVRLSTAESREDADLTQQFIDETFVISMDSDVKYQQALKTYQVWAEAGGISGKQRLNRSNFSKAMREHGIAIEMSGDHENVKVLRHLAYRRFLVGE